MYFDLELCGKYILILEYNLEYTFRIQYDMCQQHFVYIILACNNIYTTLCDGAFNFTLLIFIYLFVCIAGMMGRHCTAHVWRTENKL